MRNGRWALLTIGFWWCLSVVGLGADAWDAAPVRYRESVAADPVAKLIERVDGDLASEYPAADEPLGRLAWLLDELQVPVQSQTLVFSKTSLQTSRISPWHPRALYFNDDVYVGYVHGGDIEIAATDPQLGAVFYTLDMDATGGVIERDSGNCLSCHASHRTQDVPGYFMRSVSTKRSGQPDFRLGSKNTTVESLFEDRFGGWYVSGHDLGAPHGGRRVDHRFVARDYPHAHSDIAALLVLTHQGQMHNAIARSNHDARRAMLQNGEINRLLDRDEGFVSESTRRRFEHAADRVLRHLVFASEVGFERPAGGVEGHNGDADTTETSGFREVFEARGPFDGQGRSLRQLDLRTRTLRYRCSYLIYSDAFAGLPDAVRELVLKGLRAGLTSGEDDRFAHLSGEEKSAVDAILRATLPEYEAVR